ncbi:MAG: sulfurtransferase TusA family protein [Nitrospirota bacterium]|nr:MAG: sulfurtransferase TusA family protein [Nitrospirota bacterium]
MGDKVLDLRGLKYTMPVVKTAAALKKAEPGDVFEVINDYPGFKDDIKRFCDETGNSLVDISSTDTETRATIKKA